MHTLTLSLLSAGLAGCGANGGVDTTSGVNGGNFSSSGTSGPLGGTPIIPVGSGGGVLQQGTLNRAELGGSGNLTVSTIQQFNAVVKADGSFEVLGSPTNPQLLFVSDGQGTLNRAEDTFLGTLKALAINIQGTSLRIGAESTALAMLFLTYGVLTVDPAEAAQTLQQLKALPSFGLFRDFLVSRIGSTSLGALAADPQLAALRATCVAEFKAQQTPPVTAKLTLENFAQMGGMELATADQAPPQAPGVRLSNFGTRFVNVVRQEVNGQGQDTVTPVACFLTEFVQLDPNQHSTMSGLNMISWGSLGANQLFDAGEAIDRFTPHPQTVQVNYWIEGPGFGRAIQLPATVKENLFSTFAYESTYMVFFVCPILDIMAGGQLGLEIMKSLKFGRHPLAVIEALGHTLEPVFTATSVLSSAVQLAGSCRSGNDGNKLGSSIDLLIGVCSALSSLPTTAFDAFLRALPAEVPKIEFAGYRGACSFLTSAFSRGATVTGVLAAVLNLGTAVGNLLDLPNLVRLVYSLSKLTYLDGTANGLLHVDQDGWVLYRRTISGAPDIIEYRLRKPPVGGVDVPEGAVIVEPIYHLVAANNNKQVFGYRSPIEHFGSGNSRETLVRYPVLGEGSGNGEVIFTINVSNPLPVSLGSPGQDKEYTLQVVNDLGDVVGTYQKFLGNTQFNPSDFRQNFGPDLFHVPPQGPIVKLNVGAAVRQMAETNHPLGANVVRANVSGYRCLSLNNAGKLLFVWQIIFFNQTGQTTTGIEVGLALLDIGTGLLQDVDYMNLFPAGIDNVLDRYRTAFINDFGDITLTKFAGILDSLIVSRRFKGNNGIPTLGNAESKNRLYVGGLDKHGVAVGFEIISNQGQGTVDSKARIWRYDGTVEDGHALLSSLDPDIQPTDQSQFNGVGDNGHFVGRLITRRLLNPEQPPGPDNPEGEVVKDFLISPRS